MYIESCYLRFPLISYSKLTRLVLCASKSCQEMSVKRLFYLPNPRHDYLPNAFSASPDVCSPPVLRRQGIHHLNTLPAGMCVLQKAHRCIVTPSCRSLLGALDKNVFAGFSETLRCNKRDMPRPP
jgi:hypothetical protein